MVGLLCFYNYFFKYVAIEKNVWFNCLTAYQFLVGYLKLELDLFLNVCNQFFMAIFFHFILKKKQK